MNKMILSFIMFAVSFAHAGPLSMFPKLIVEKMDQTDTGIVKSIAIERSRNTRSSFTKDLPTHVNFVMPEGVLTNVSSSGYYSLCEVLSAEDRTLMANVLVQSKITGAHKRISLRSRS